jgi:hypothetical protein
MSYALSFKTVREKTTLYAIIQDRETSLFWDEGTDTWVDTIVAGCNLALTESADKGVYTGSATFTPVNGGVYQISVFDSADADYQMDTIEVYPSKTKTVLQVINDVQLELRMPLSSALTDNFAKIILAKMNTVLMEILPERNIFDHLKVQGSFVIGSTRPFYRLSPTNVDSVETITFLRLPNMDYIDRAKDDMEFRTVADTSNASLTYGDPTLYRISQRDGGFPIIEFTPQPDVTKIISYEIIKGAKELTLATEYAPLPRVLKAGAHFLMLKSQGRDADVEGDIFERALGRAATVGANTHMGDIEV